MPLFFAINQGLTLRIHSFFIFGCMKLLVSCFIIVLGVSLLGCLDREKEYDLLVGESHTIQGRFTKNCDGEPFAGAKLRLMPSDAFGRDVLKPVGSCTTDPNGNFQLVYRDPLEFTKLSAYTFVIEQEVAANRYEEQSVPLRPYTDLKVNLIDSITSTIFFVALGANSLSNSDTLFLSASRPYGQSVEHFFTGPFVDGAIIERIAYQNLTGYYFFQWAVGHNNRFFNYPDTRHAGNYGELSLQMPHCGVDTLYIDLSNTQL